MALNSALISHCRLSSLISIINDKIILLNISAASIYKVFYFSQSYFKISFLPCFMKCTRQPGVCALFILGRITVS